MGPGWPKSRRHAQALRFLIAMRRARSQPPRPLHNSRPSRRRHVAIPIRRPALCDWRRCGREETERSSPGMRNADAMTKDCQKPRQPKVRHEGDVALTSDTPLPARMGRSWMDLPQPYLLGSRAALAPATSRHSRSDTWASDVLGIVRTTTPPTTCDIALVSWCLTSVPKWTICPCRDRLPQLLHMDEAGAPASADYEHKSGVLSENADRQAKRRRSPARQTTMGTERR